MMMRISFNRRVTGSRSRRATRAALAVAAGSWAMVVMGIIPRPPRRFRGVRRVLRGHRTAAAEQRTPRGGGGGGRAARRGGGGGGGGGGAAPPLPAPSAVNAGRSPSCQNVLSSSDQLG